METSANELSKRIYTLRGIPVMLDSDLATAYNVKVKALKQAVKRNIERFPGDFMFELTKEEFENLICQSGTSSCAGAFEINARSILRSQIVTSSLKAGSRTHGGNRYMPFAFTEPGVAMLSSVLNSERAIQVNIGIMRTFIQLRKQSKVYEPRDPVKTIQEVVAKHWGLQVEDLKSAARKKSISLARQVAIYLIRQQMHLSFPEIGVYFGNRDHTTILHAYNKILVASGTNGFLHETVMFLQASLKGTLLARPYSLQA